MFQLPGGGRVGICSKRDWMADGREFVGVGIQPDLTVAPTVQDVRAGRDPVMEVALAELREAGDAPAR
jgi:C-terminal processing protease CtpA/Prc